MRQKKLKLIFLFFFMLGLTGLQAQESINASGGEATGSGGSVSYSVGQMVYQTHAGASGSVAEGVQQPYEISVVTGTDEAKNINLSVSAYPNPASDYLIMEVGETDLADLSWQLFDINGKLLQTRDITDTRTQISMSELAPATYIVKVLKSHQQVKTFKIIKTK